MKRFILLAMIASVLFSCSTPKQIAQRKLKRAIELDPNIIKDIRVDTTISGVAKGNIIVQTPESEGEFNLNCDSLKKALNDYKKNDLKPGQVLLYSDSNLNVSAKKDSAGNYKIKYKFKPKYIKVPVKVPFEVKVKVPGKKVEVFVDKPFYHYLWFYIMLSIILLESFLLIKVKRKVVYVQEQTPPLK